MMVVGGVGSVKALKPLLLFLHEVGVSASAGGGHSGQPAVGPRRWRWSRGRRRDRSWDLCRKRDGGWG